ncbi:MAG: hypothetical protein JMM77_00515 [Candidatus Xiphinematobacter sp.]|nr:MAG: hypothetical protein JMM77_00515 [Candidatus Xiphinematobacter sp.]
MCYLANVSPKLQKYTLGQVQSPLFVAANTMDFWIKGARKTLLSLLRYVDMLILNEREARELTGVTGLVRAGNLLLELGPELEFVVLSKGEHGALLLGKNSLFSCPAYPLGAVRDPTGAGRQFRGGVVGYLANTCNEKNSSGITFEKLRLAVICGTVLASLSVEAFGLERLCTLT